MSFITLPTESCLKLSKSCGHNSPSSSFCFLVHISCLVGDLGAGGVGGQSTKRSALGVCNILSKLFEVLYPLV